MAAPRRRLVSVPIDRGGRPLLNPRGEEERRPPPGGAEGHRPGQDPQRDPRPNPAQDPAPGQQPAVQPEVAAQLRRQSPENRGEDIADPFEPTPDQLKEAETLLDNRKQWFKDLNRPTDKRFRRQVTEMAHSIIFTSKQDAKDAFDMALFHVDLRPQIQEAVGKDINPSSDPDLSSVPDPVPVKLNAPSKGKEKESSPSKKRKAKRSKDKSKSKKKLKRQDSSDTESSSRSSSSSPSSDSSD
ncbi:unnamed protein product [Tilletia controversa]|nr:unnamed protein product [Tilletia controversa]